MERSDRSPHGAPLARNGVEVPSAAPEGSSLAEKILEQQYYR